MLKVTLIEHTPNPERLVAAAAKLCYSHMGVDEIYKKGDDEDVSRFIKMLSDLGHESPIEHVTFTFGIEGVSRSLLAQLTRHRIASYSVKSQRYVTEGSFEFVTPPEIAKDETALALYLESMKQAQEKYDKLAEILKERHKKDFLAQGKEEKEAARLAEKKAIEDARYVLPNACETKLVATFNARSLLNFFKHRLCERAQWEIRDMAYLMYKEVAAVAPTLFSKAGPPCAFGACPEGKMTCGKAAEKRKIFAGK
ncbi:MAG: FAD-dependent thymidylate synthase [Clostridia bacterium]|nr:FAD-dependent thymidylate synthase [Clostridia bacterium]